MSNNKQRKIKILRKAITILTEQKKWGRGFFAKTINGDETSPWSKEAVCLCALGALSVAADPNNKHKVKLDYGHVLPVVNEVTQDVQSVLDVIDLAVWNDNKKRDKRQVIRAFEKTIQYIQEHG